MPRHAWALDLSEPETGRSREDLPKPPGYSEQHAHESVNNSNLIILWLTQQSQLTATLAFACAG